MKVPHFVDTVVADVAGGNGGNGCVGFRREKFVPRGGPDGGDGGRGGHVILQADHQVDSLLAIYFQPRYHASGGGNGSGQRRHGRNGADLIVKVPCGTVIRDEQNGEALGELIASGEQLCVARGGKGGLGNCHWKTNTHQAPREHTDGEPGEQKRLRLDLKLIADIGLIGFPNAGKSTLLSAISSARPKIASYPFTTLNPILGTIEGPAFHAIKIVDIPGIIRGAHTGAGLGLAFLRHIERTRVLVFVIDMAGVDGRRPADDFEILCAELRCYNQTLLQRSFLVVANKMDLEAASENFAEFIRVTGQKPLPLSALNKDGTEALQRELEKLSAAKP